MRRTWRFPAAELVLLFLVPAAFAASPLDNLRKLHAEGKTEQAFDLVKKLQTRPPAGVQAVDLALEAARLSIELARRPAPPARRDGRLQQARAESAAFLSRYPKHPAAAEVSLAFARVCHACGAEKLIEISQIDDQATRSAKRASIRPLFETAQAAYARVREMAPSAPVEYERALNAFDLASTFGDAPQEATKRGEALDRASKEFSNLAKASEGTALAWQARAWAARCLQEIDSPQNAVKEYATILQATSDSAEAGKRLAGYFRLLALDRNPALYAGSGDADTEVIRGGEEWLRNWNAAEAAERQGVLFAIGNAYLRRGDRLGAQPQFAGRARPLYLEAERRFRAVARSDSEFTRPAREARNSVLTALAGRARSELTTLNTFDECYVHSEIELLQMAEAARKPLETAQAAATAKQRLTGVIAALNRALDQADETTSADDIGEARSILAWAHLQQGDCYRAAVLAEEVARHAPLSRMAATAASYAIEAYAQISDEEARRAAPARALASDRRRLEELARYMEQRWPEDRATDTARHHLGDLAFREHRYPQAVTTLSQIAPSYGAYTLAQYELANAALLAQEANASPPAGQPTYQQQAVAALNRIPDLVDGADPATARIYMSAKLMLVKSLFAARDFKAIAGLTERLTRQLERANLDPATREAMRSSVDELAFYSVLGKADELLRAGKYDEVRAELDPLVADYRRNRQTVKDPELARAMLSLALRADVQTDNMAAARELLGLLQSSAGELDKGGASSILLGLVRQMEAQVQALRKDGPARQLQLERTISRFSAFLDEISKQPAKAMTPEFRRFLAIAYASLNRHDKAAELLSAASRPTPATPENENVYRSTRILLARELRLDKRFGRASAVLDELAATEAGKRSLEVRYERIHILEDQGQYVRAAREWDKIMKSLAPLMNSHPELLQKSKKQPLGDKESAQLARQNRYRDEYFDCYFHFVECCVQHALTATDSAKRAERLQRAAVYILRLEENQPELWLESQQQRYRDMLDKEPLLKTQYTELKGTSPKGGTVP
jgi:hypothetical protein